MEMMLHTTRRPDITFRANGMITITARVSRILNLSDHSCINIAVHDGEYLLVADNSPELVGNRVGRCYSVNTGSRHLRANSVRLCRAIFSACGITDRDSLAFLCGEPVFFNNKLHLPIITRRPL